MAKYLSDLVDEAQDKILTVKIESIGAPEENMRNGKMMRRVSFVFPATGRSHSESLFDTTFKYDLKGVKVGDTVEVFVKENGYLGYRILNASAEAAIERPSQTPYRQVQNERAATKSLNDQDEKSIAICLQGFMQAFIIQGRDIPAALTGAVEARERLVAKAKEIHTGIPAQPQAAPDDSADLFPANDPNF